MAVSYSHFAPMVVVIQKSVSTKRPSSVMVSCTANNNFSINRTPFQIRLPPTSNKVVFEDQTRGIVCYCDENGEIICEGFDEGPRFQNPNSNPRDAEIIDLLQKRLYQIARDDKFY